MAGFFAAQTSPSEDITTTCNQHSCKLSKINLFLPKTDELTNVLFKYIIRYGKAL